MVAREEHPAVGGAESSWKVLVVDDDEIVHQVTKFCLAKTKVGGKPIELLSAFSGNEAIDLTLQRKDIDLILMDCIMETDTAGFKAAEFLKEHLKIKKPVIVMRSGYAGLEFEENLNKYPYIDDFLSKVEASKANLVGVLQKWLAPKQAT